MFVSLKMKREEDFAKLEEYLIQEKCNAKYAGWKTISAKEDCERAARPNGFEGYFSYPGIIHAAYFNPCWQNLLLNSIFRFSKANNSDCVVRCFYQNNDGAAFHSWYEFSNGTGNERGYFDNYEELYERA